MSYQHFDYAVDNGVATVTFTRPDRLNSLTFEVYDELTRLPFDLMKDESVKVLVVTGTGRGFCSGGDVEEIIGALFSQDMRGVLEFTRMTGTVVSGFRQLDKPIIAALNGMTAGAGAAIAMASDFRIMVEGAKWRFLFTNVGLTGADMGACWMLPRLIGLGRATEVLMLGDAIPAEEARRIGLVNQVVPADQLMKAANDLARRLADGPSLAISMTKKMLNNEMNMDLLTAIEQEAQAQALMLMGKDHKEFYHSFKEKRAPRFIGR